MAFNKVLALCLFAALVGTGMSADPTAFIVSEQTNGWTHYVKVAEWTSNDLRADLQNCKIESQVMGNLQGQVSVADSSKNGDLLEAIANCFVELDFLVAGMSDVVLPQADGKDRVMKVSVLQYLTPYVA